MKLITDSIVLCCYADKIREALLETQWWADFCRPLVEMKAVIGRKFDDCVQVMTHISSTCFFTSGRCAQLGQNYSIAICMLLMLKCLHTCTVRLDELHQLYMVQEMHHKVYKIFLSVESANYIRFMQAKLQQS